MKNYQKNSHWRGNRGGIVTTVVIIVVLLLILSYYGFNLRQTVQSPTTQDNFSYAWGGVTYVWDNYLEGPADYSYNFFISYIWKPVVANMENLSTLNSDRVSK